MALNVSQPSEVPEEPWMVVRTRRGSRTFPRSDVDLLPTNNVFLALQVEYLGDCSRADEKSVPQSMTLVVGDSQVMC